MNILKRILGKEADIVENPIGSANLLFRRTTKRYGKKGTISANRGYLKISRDAETGQFVSRSA